MSSGVRLLLIIPVLLAFAGISNAQIDDICVEAGVFPSLDLPRERVPYVYGRVTLIGFERGAKMPRVTVTLTDTQQQTHRQRLDKSGNYCFRRTATGGGTLLVEVDGFEVARKSLPLTGPAQVREDFEVYPANSQRPASPGAISAKFVYPPNEKTSDLYKKVLQAEKDRDKAAAINYLKEIVAIDPEDFIAWAKLGSAYFDDDKLDDAYAAFRKSLELKVEYTPAWIFAGRIRYAQKQYEAAIEIFKHAGTLEPTSARIYQLLGEAYLQAKKGTLGAEALNKAIELDPIGMADCHLLLAKLYDLAGAKNLASREYMLFLEKRPDHPDKKKLEKFIRENPHQ